MAVQLRTGRPSDAGECGRIAFEAFRGIATQHGFPPDLPEGAARGMMDVMLNHPGIYAVVAERDGRVVGSNFMDERSPVAGIGPLTVDPAEQDRSVGRRLMEKALERVAE